MSTESETSAKKISAEQPASHDKTVGGMSEKEPSGVFKALRARIQKWRNWPTDPDREWYYAGPLTKRWFGNAKFHTISAVGYFCVAVGLPIVVLLQKGSTDSFIAFLKAHPVGTLLWLAFVSVSLPYFIWLEQLAFDTWIKDTAGYRSREQNDRQKERFSINARHMETFWKSVAGLYLTAGLISFSAGGGDKSEEKAPTQKDVHQLTVSITKLTESVKSATTRHSKQELQQLTRAVSKLAESMEREAPTSPGSAPPPPAATGPGADAVKK